VHEFALSYWLQAGLLHQAAHLVTADVEAAISQRRDQATAAVLWPLLMNAARRCTLALQKAGLAARRLAS